MWYTKLIFGELLKEIFWKVHTLTVTNRFHINIINPNIFVSYIANNQATVCIKPGHETESV